MNHITDRDGAQCVCCGTPLAGQRYSVHHRIYGNRGDNRPSNLVTLLGTGTTLHHMQAHRRKSTWAIPNGYAVSRHAAREATLVVPVWYYQPALGRVGWFLLDDDGGLTAYQGPELAPAPRPFALEATAWTSTRPGAAPAPRAGRGLPRTRGAR